MCVTLKQTGDTDGRGQILSSNRSALIRRGQQEGESQERQHELTKLKTAQSKNMKVISHHMVSGDNSVLQISGKIEERLKKRLEREITSILQRGLPLLKRSQPPLTTKREFSRNEESTKGKPKP